jgi:hypothetical protein
MKAIAAFFGKSVLRDINYKQIILQGNEIRKSCGDRSLLRAIHYFTENRRVDEMADKLRKLATAENLSERNLYFGQFLKLVNESGNSSWELLQNVYTPANTHEQSLSLALALTHDFLTRISTDEGSCPGGLPRSRRRLCRCYSSIYPKKSNKRICMSDGMVFRDEFGNAYTHPFNRGGPIIHKLRGIGCVI